MAYTFQSHEVGTHVDALEQIFTSTVSADWSSNSGDAKDRAFVISSGDTEIGFVAVHNRAPYAFGVTGECNAYLYNLCVLPEHQARGAGTALLEHVKLHYDSVQLHADLNSYKPGWLERTGFVRAERRSHFIEYTWNPSSTAVSSDDASISERLKLPYYCWENNIVYLQPIA